MIVDSSCYTFDRTDNAFLVKSGNITSDDLRGHLEHDLNVEVLKLPQLKIVI